MLTRVKAEKKNIKLERIYNSAIYTKKLVRNYLLSLFYLILSKNLFKKNFI